MKTLLDGFFSSAPSERIVVDSTGFQLRRDQDFVGRLQWAEIARVEVFKRDRLTTDLICIEILSRSGVAWELNEDMPGFDGLMVALAAQLPGFTQDWRGGVAKPVFASNRRVLFDRTAEPE